LYFSTDATQNECQISLGELGIFYGFDTLYAAALLVVAIPRNVLRVRLCRRRLARRL
jgi:hypothetical protein